MNDTERIVALIREVIHSASPGMSSTDFHGGIWEFDGPGTADAFEAYRELVSLCWEDSDEATALPGYLPP